MDKYQQMVKRHRRLTDELQSLPKQRIQVELTKIDEDAFLWRATEVDSHPSTGETIRILSEVIAIGNDDLNKPWDSDYDFRYNIPHALWDIIEAAAEDICEYETVYGIANGKVMEVKIEIPL